MQLFGMGADQVLALEVVTADGKFVTATPTLNSDLYWAILLVKNHVQNPYRN